MYEALNKDTMKYEILPHLSVEKHSYVSKRTWRKSFKAISTSQKLAVNGRLLLRLHDIVSAACEQHALQPLVLAVVSEVVFCAIAYVHVCDRIVFVWFSAKILTL